MIELKPQAESLESLLSTAIGLLMSHKERIGYKPNSVIAKFVDECVERLKDWPMDTSTQQPQTRPDFTDEWTGYLKDGETPFERFLRERKDLQSMLRLYQRVLEENERLKAQQPQPTTPQATTVEDAARDVGKWLNERPNRELDLRSVAMLVAHAQQAQPSDDAILQERDEAEDFIDALLDEVLGADRPEWSSAYGRAEALAEVQERMAALEKPMVDRAWQRFEQAQAEAAPSDVVRDAERYRFLAAHCRSTPEHWGGRWSIVIEGPCPERQDCEDAFDDAIDAAIAQQKGQP